MPELMGVPAERLFEAVKTCKRKCKYFPALAEIIDAARPGPYDERPATHSNGRIVDGKFQPWGGACQCRRCIEKIPREGFYKAPREMYEQRAYEDEQSEAFWARRQAELPKIERGEKFADYKNRVDAWKEEAKAVKGGDSPRPTDHEPKWGRSKIEITPKSQELERDLAAERRAALERRIQSGGGG